MHRHVISCKPAKKPHFGKKLISASYKLFFCQPLPLLTSNFIHHLFIIRSKIQLNKTDANASHLPLSKRTENIRLTLMILKIKSNRTTCAFSFCAALTIQSEEYGLKVNFHALQKSAKSTASLFLPMKFTMILFFRDTPTPFFLQFQNTPQKTA